MNSNTPPPRLSEDAGSPQGAPAGAGGSDRAARDGTPELSTGSDEAGSTPFREPFTDTMTFHLLRLFGLTLAALILAGGIGLLAMRAALDDHPDPWSTVQLLAAETLVRITQVFAAVSAVGAGLVAVLLIAGLALLAIDRWTGRSPELRAHPEPTTGGRERE